jgi:UDP-N-acetyl-D-galactosamine dehydrogenase
LADAHEAQKYYGIALKSMESLVGMDAVVVAVAHKTYKEAGLEAIAALCSAEKAIVVDIKGVFSPDAQAGKVVYWRL